MERSSSVCESIGNYLHEYQRWSVWRTIFLGQLLSLLLCAFQYVSHHLSTSLEMTIFTSQNYLRYMTTCCVFTTMLAFRSGENSLFNVIKTRGYRYILIGLVDLEANTLVGMSHQFSSLINIQFLHCVSLPVSIILSCLTLGVRFRLVHMIGVSICLMGIGSLVSAGIGGAAVEGHDDKPQLLSDMLCVAGSILFAVSCVMQEIICKTFDCIEYLGMTGLYGACLCGIQMFLVEKQTLMNVDWSNTDILVYLAAFALLQFLFYSILPHILQNSGSTAVQLYLLTADFYTLVAGVMTNQYKFHSFYLLSFLLTMTGIYIYSIKRLAIFNFTASTEMLDEMHEVNGGGQLTDLTNGIQARDYAQQHEIMENIELSPTIATIQTITKASTNEKYVPAAEVGTRTTAPTKMTTFQKY